MDEDWTARFPQRARVWRLRTRALTFDRTPRIMGIVNVTPDSFSDGGQFLDASRAVDHALQLAGEGADVLDVGGESTRPYATPVLLEEELRRVIPVIERVCRETTVPVSVDTSKSVVAEAALEAGAEIVNDVTGGSGDPRMLDLLHRHRPGICLMHMQGTPQTMQDAPHYVDLVSEIFDYLAQRRDAFVSLGLDPQQLCLDPGIGFGKTHQQNLTLLAKSGHFHRLGCPLLIGHSRKAFLGKLSGRASDPEARRWATVGATMVLAQQGVQVVRVHDVGPVRAALAAFVGAGGVDGQTCQWV